MKRLWLVAAVVLMGTVGPGCGERSETSRTAAPGDAGPEPVLLPEWAPENPSPEFLRAARVLRPFPELPSAEESARGELVDKALSYRFTRTLPAAWEFFGSLSDEQLARFLASKRVVLRVKDLSPKQKTALYHYFEVWRQAFKGRPPHDPEFVEDWLVELYKSGAREDLSNVQIEFLVRGSGRVAMFLRARLPDGSFGPICPVGIGNI